MFGSGLARKRVRRPGTSCGITRRSRRLPLLAATALAASSLAFVAPPASAASVTSAAFSGGGTFTAANGTVYAKQGAPLTLTLNTDPDTQCVDVIDGSGATIAT